MSSWQQRNNDVQEPAKMRPVALVVALALMALVLAFVVWRLQPPAAQGMEAPSDKFSAGRAMAVLQELLAEGVPHPAGSANNDRVRERIVARLEELGYEVEIQETVVCRNHSGARATCAPVKNLLASLPGQADGPAVVVMAHYDSVGGGPGAADDTSNVAAILEIARILADQGPSRNPILLLLTDAEEIGLIGAQGFVEQHPGVKDVGVVVNLEARGTSGRSLMFETSDDNAWLMDAFAAAVSRPSTNSLMYEVYKIMPNDTDLTVFKRAGLAGFNFAYIEQAQHYHTLLDNVDNVDPGSLQHQGENVLALVQELATRDLSNPPAGNAVYMDMPGNWLLKWPESWTLPLAALALLLLLVVAGWLVRRAEMTLGALLWGLLAALLAVILPILLGMGLTWLISQVSGDSRPWHAYPLPTRASLWAGALLCSSLIALGLARRAGLWGLGLGAWLLCALLSLILSLTLPGATIILLVPLLCAAILLAIVAFSGLSASALAREVAFIAAALVGGIIWLPMSLTFEAALSFDLSAAVVLWVALVASLLLPLFALPSGRVSLRRGLLAAIAAIMVIAAVVAMLVPTYSEFSPHQLNLYHYENVDTGAAYWVAAPLSGDVPQPLRQHFEDEPQAVLPWSTWKFTVAEAPTTGALAPDLEVLAGGSSGEQAVTVRLRSPRGAEKIELALPIDRLKSLTFAGHRLPVDAGDSWDGFYDLQCYGYACDGLELALEFKGASPVEVFVVDHSMGLPAGGESLIQARPATAVPAQEGDLTLVSRRVELQPE